MATTQDTNPKDVEVTKDNPLYITDDNRTFGTVTIVRGGQVWVQTRADIRIEKLVKTDSPEQGKEEV